MLIDTHIHLDFLADLPRVLMPARAAGVGAWVVPGVAPADWPRLLTTVAAVPGAFAAPGVHPQQADHWRPHAEADTLRRLLADPCCIAVGEVGLDGKDGPEATTQEEVFRQMIRLAREAGLPLLLHTRRAIGRTLEILREERAQDVGGIAHAYSGSVETAYELIRLGFALGIGRVVTFPKKNRMTQVVRSVPQEWLLLETDAPDLPPYPYLGEANRPEWLALIAARLGDLRGWSLAETARITTANARRVLRLPDEKESSS